MAARGEGTAGGFNSKGSLATAAHTSTPARNRSQVGVSGVEGLEGFSSPLPLRKRKFGLAAETVVARKRTTTAAVTTTATATTTTTGADYYHRHHHHHNHCHSQGEDSATPPPPPPPLPGTATTTTTAAAAAAATAATAVTAKRRRLAAGNADLRINEVRECGDCVLDNPHSKRQRKNSQVETSRSQLNNSLATNAPQHTPTRSQDPEKSPSGGILKSYPLRNRLSRHVPTLEGVASHPPSTPRPSCAQPRPPTPLQPPPPPPPPPLAEPPARPESPDRVWEAGRKRTGLRSLLFHPNGTVGTSQTPRGPVRVAANTQAEAVPRWV
ncbi:hypothetical protein O3P69_019475 [Scylla paramamosain]|uniref:Uncharacterized protein n=1 Tax=Scylla paramamosain TaxID=85552 RepID=A0AAW0SXV2_SCYPA